MLMIGKLQTNEAEKAKTVKAEIYMGFMLKNSILKTII